MSPENVKKLNQLNYDFYQNIGQFFNQSRSNIWEGWTKLKNIIISSNNSNSPIRVLELGCGNGRFLDFLHEQQFAISEYIGLDTSDFLLQKATERLTKLSQLNAKVKKVDLLFDDWCDSDYLQKFDLVCLFGVLHHIPGKSFRTDILQKSAKCLSKNGLLVFTTWQYKDVPRLNRRVLPKQDPRITSLAKEYKFDITEFEINDNILDWHKGQIAYRFSHYYTHQEIVEYLDLADLVIDTVFEADGKEGNVNKYYICKT